MIAVQRTAQPRILATKRARWLAALQAVMADPTATQKQKQAAQSKYGHRTVKESLVGMFHEKCAYCESLITHITYGAIEHFRPKSVFPDLTFEWINLLLSCDKCNDAGHKGDLFPIDPQGNPLLIDPTDAATDPNAHLRFSWDPTAAVAGVYGRDTRGDEVVRIFDLNGQRGRRELLQHRCIYVKKLMALLRLALAHHDQQAIDILRDACRPSDEYSAFARALVEDALPPIP